jgi:hypothetical protein
VTNVTATATTSQTGTAFGSAAGSGSDVMLNNFIADDYATVSIEAMDSIVMTTVDFGTSPVTITPGGTVSTGSGPAGDHAVFDDVTMGSLSMTRTQPGTFDDVSMGAFTMTGNAITSDLVTMNLDGCGCSDREWLRLEHCNHLVEIWMDSVPTDVLLLLTQ